MVRSNKLLMSFSRIALGLVAMMLAAKTAEAAPKREQCVQAYEETQVAMRRSRLLDARQSLQVCLDQACPAMLRSDCAGWLKEVEARTPSVVIELVAGEGVAVKEAKLFVDGKPRDQGIDGKAMEVDPGNHTFKIEAPDSVPASVDILAREGEKLRVVRVELQSTKKPVVPPKPPVTEPKPNPNPNNGDRQRPIPTSVYAAAGIGVVAAAGFTVFAISGSSGKSDLEPCKPECSADEIGSVRTKFIVADVFLGVSVVALAAATYLFLTRPSVGGASTVGSSGGSHWMMRMMRLKGGGFVF
jgi:hypothetical protein